MLSGLRANKTSAALLIADRQARLARSALDIVDVIEWGNGTSRQHEHALPWAEPLSSTGSRLTNPAAACECMLPLLVALLQSSGKPLCKESVTTAGFTLGCRHYTGSTRGASF